MACSSYWAIRCFSLPCVQAGSHCQHIKLNPCTRQLWYMPTYWGYTSAQLPQRYLKGILLCKGGSMLSYLLFGALAKFKWSGTDRSRTDYLRRKRTSRHSIKLLTIYAAVVRSKEGSMSSWTPFSTSQILSWTTHFGLQMASRVLLPS